MRAVTVPVGVLGPRVAIRTAASTALPDVAGEFGRCLPGSTALKRTSGIVLAYCVVSMVTTLFDEP